MSVLLETSLGDLVVDLHVDQAPRTCRNFLKLCQIKYYNHCHVFKVERDFLIQAGDPVQNDGAGGRSVYGMVYGEQADLFEGEISPHLKHDRIGTLSMVGAETGAGVPLHGSQFFITTADDRQTDWLDGKHTVFGRVIEGFDTLSKINSVFVDKTRNNRPYQVVRIHHTHTLDDPYTSTDANLPGFADLVPPTSPLISLEDLKEEMVHRLAEDQGLNGAQVDTNQETTEEQIRLQAAKDARSRAEVLEMIGDIEDADMKPPENVLFICKLNPATNEEDLELIFSRFGVHREDSPVRVSIIRDHMTQDSLCYGFIEFPDPKSCEAAYYKMDNTLIDDRRVRVDFSQSVAKLWNDAMRRGKKVRVPPERRQERSQAGGHEARLSDSLVFDTPALDKQAGVPYQPSRKRSKQP